MVSLPRAVDVVVIGGGPNGLVSAALLADAGWSVLLLEAQAELGGSVKSQSSDGWTMDRFSACYPLAKASPVLRALELHEHGLIWADAKAALAHALGPDDHEGAAIYADRLQTAGNLGAEFQSDADTWLELCAQFDIVGGDFLDALLTSWPPVNSARRLVKRLGGTAEFLRFARFLALPAYRMGEELFKGQRGRALLSGNAMHADSPLDAPVSGTMGWLMSMLAQSVGFPSPVGGAAQLTAALASRARAAGAELVTAEPVVGVDVRGGKAVGVRTASGQRIFAAKAVIADTSATALYRDLLHEADLPASLLADLEKFQWDLPTVKVNYRLSHTPAWTAVNARTAGVVHAGGDAAKLVRWSADLTTGAIPEVPFALVGQMTQIDPTRSPTGTEAMWAYTHLPRGIHDDESAELVAARLDRMIEQHAPGFTEEIIDRQIQTPRDLEAENANLVGGAVGGGTSQLFQQLVFRPVPGVGGARTVVDNLYLGSAAIHPGGGVHGACGALAARAAIADNARLGGLRKRAASGVIDRIYRAEKAV
ncbi:phytoene desaturase family protein [Jatrophihabitans sp. DSM 45814]